MLKQITALCFCVFALGCHADTYIIGAQNIRYFPHYDFSQHNVDKGLAWAILEAYADESGHEFRYLPMPIKRLQMELLKGNVDLLYPDNPKWFNQVIPSSAKTFSQPLTRALGGTILKPINVGKGIDSIKRIGVPLGFSPVNWQHRIEAKLTELVEVNNVISVLQMLQLDRVHGADLEYNVAQHIVSTTPGLGPFTLDPQLPYDNVGFMLSTIKNKALIKDINRFINENQEVIIQLKARYQLDDPEVILQTLRNKHYPNSKRPLP